MRFQSFGAALVVSCMVSFTAPALAGHTAIDQNDQTGAPTSATVGGYCDLNGEDCDPQQLSYQVKLGGSDFTNLITIHGNGVISFGGSIDFSSTWDEIQNGETPDLTEYNHNLVSAGQNTSTYMFDSSSFWQSADPLTFGADGSISAEWYTCFRPVYSCHANVFTLKLTPKLLGGQSGYYGVFNFNHGDPGGSDIGFVVDGAYTQTGNTFFLPAQFEGLQGPLQAVPEPATWGLMILGFGAVGASLRANRRRVAALAA